MAVGLCAAGRHALLSLSFQGYWCSSWLDLVRVSKIAHCSPFFVSFVMIWWGWCGAGFAEGEFRFVCCEDGGILDISTAPRFGVGRCKWV